MIPTLAYLFVASIGLMALAHRKDSIFAVCFGLAFGICMIGDGVAYFWAALTAGGFSMLAYFVMERLRSPR